jgi:hypothetical protein
MKKVNSLCSRGKSRQRTREIRYVYLEYGRELPLMKSAANGPPRWNEVTLLPNRMSLNEPGATASAKYSRSFMKPS